MTPDQIEHEYKRRLVSALQEITTTVMAGCVDPNQYWRFVGMSEGLKGALVTYDEARDAILGNSPKGTASKPDGELY